MHRDIKRIYVLLSILAVVVLIFHYDVVRKRHVAPDLRTVVRISGPTEEGGMAVGSGVLIAPRKVITNSHVIAGLSSIQIEYCGTEGIETYEARVIKDDPLRDLALLEIDVSLHRQVVIGLDDAACMAPGHDLIFVGASGGLAAQNETEGKLTSKGIRITERATWWQASAPITNGNSGGAVFDADTGFLVGITTAGWVIPSQSPFMPPMPAPNIAFFVPAYVIRAFLDDTTTTSPPPGSLSPGTPETKTEK